MAQADERGFGMLGSSVFVANPPHTLFAELQPVMPYLAQVLAQVMIQRGERLIQQQRLRLRRRPASGCGVGSKCVGCPCVSPWVGCVVA